jgi:hypothetical protein
MTPLRTYAVALAGLLLAAPAIAQTTVPQAPSSPGAPAPAHPRVDTPGESPNESLGQAPNSGVLKPPATGDNGVIVPREHSSSPMPEIRPPGTPDSKPNVEPK